MKKLFEESIFTRNVLVGLLDAYTHNQLIHIPAEFNNSIFWNIAHLMVTPQLLCYRRSGLDIEIDEKYVKRYGKGSKPSDDISVNDVNYVREHLNKSVLKIKSDYEKGRFQKYEAYMTSTGIELTCIEDALRFSAFHDGIHLGIILSLKKLV